MMSTPIVSIVGQFDPEYPAHVATHDALIHAMSACNVVLNTKWVTPTQIVDRDDILDGTCCALIAPRNPKTPRQLWPEILASLEWFEARKLPVLGLEFGYQHMIIDLARRLLDRPDANSTAYDENASFPVISRLESDQPPIDKFSPKDISISFDAGSRLAEVYGSTGPFQEAFRGHYVANPDFLTEFESHGVHFTGRGTYGERTFVAGLERTDLPFYLGAAFLPQYNSSAEKPHPLFQALIQAGIDAL
ncbi:MAG: CTP synthase [Planctomycetota bacterium]|jgi:CTP synthase